MDRSTRRTRSSARLTNETSVEETPEEPKTQKTRGARLLEKLTSGSTSNTGSVFVNYNDSADEESRQDSKKGTNVGARGAILLEKLTKSGSASDPASATVDYEDSADESRQDSTKLLRELGDDLDVSDYDPDNSVHGTINHDCEVNNSKMTLLDRKSSANADNFNGLEQDPAKVTSAQLESDTSNDKKKASKRVREDHLETSPGSYEKRVCLETDFNEDEIDPKHEEEDNVEECSSKKGNIKQVQRENIGALHTEADAQFTGNADDNVEESNSSNESKEIQKEFNYADNQDLNFPYDNPDDGACIQEINSMVESKSIEMQSGYADVQEINYVIESKKINMPSIDAALQEMNSMVTTKKIKLLSDDAGVEEINSMVESKNINMLADEADVKAIDSMVESNNIQKQNDDANVLEVEFMVKSGNILKQFDSSGIHNMDIEDQWTESLEEKCSYNICQEILTDADKGIQENDTLAWEIANDDSEYLRESDVEEDKTSIVNSTDMKISSFLDELLDLDLTSSLGDNVGLILKRSDGVSLEPEFIEHFRSLFQCPKLDKNQNDDWRVDLPSQYARALQFCLNDFRLMDCTLEASLDAGDENIRETDDLNEWLLCIISRRMNNIWTRHNKRARALIMSALNNHAIDPMTFKCLPCTNTGCSQTTCVKYHNLGEKRNKNIVAYPQCPRRCLEPGCKRAAACKGTHTTNDVLFHHTNFLSKVCHNITASGDCKFSTPCSFAHPGTPDMFYRPEWKDLYVTGLEKSFVFLAGAIRNLKKLNTNGKKHLNQYHVVFITSQNGVADAAHCVIKELVGTHIQVVINRTTGKFQLSGSRGGILICTLPRLFELAIMQYINFSELYSLILDDASALLSDSGAPMLRKFLSILPTVLKNQESVNKVVVCSKVKQDEVLQMERLLSTKFIVKTSIPNLEKYFVPIPASRSSTRKNVSASAAATKQQQAKASSRWDIKPADTKQQQVKASSRWDSMPGQPPASTRKSSSHSAQNDAVKSHPVLGSSIVDFIAQVRADRSSPQARSSSSSNASHKDAGPHERFDHNRIQKRPDEWSRIPDDMNAVARQRYDDYNRNQKGSTDWSRNSGEKDIGARLRQDNFNRKRNIGDDWSGNLGDMDISARPRQDVYDKKRNRVGDWSGNSAGDRDAGPRQRNYDYNRKSSKDNDWSGISDVMSSRNMSSKEKVNRGRPQVQNFHSKAGIRSDSNQFGTSWPEVYSPAESRENAFRKREQRPFPLQDAKQAYPPGIGGPTNRFQGDLRTQVDYSMQESRPDQRDNRIFHDTRNTVQAASNSGAPKFSNMDEKLQAVIAPVSAVESVGPAVEAIVTAARQLGANSREALALFADKDHATILSVYFNTLEERATSLAGTDQFLIYQRAVAFGRAILNLAKRDTMK